MDWTFRTPNETGFYWHRSQDERRDARIVHVVMFDHIAKVYTDGKHLTLHEYGLGSHTMFWGPIPYPE